MDEHSELRYSNAIFWIEVDKVKPNPYQPRKEFNENALSSLAESIRQYGVLQPLVVTRKEIFTPGEGMLVEYELIAGERRLRASRIAGLSQVPAVIRDAHESDKMKLELAIIENLQREDLNPVDRAEAFAKLVSEFNLKHSEIAQKIGRSREYVSNSVRLLGLPVHILEAVRQGKITEGHARPILMLAEREEARESLFQEIITRRISVRDAEAISRRIATEKVRRPDKVFDRDTLEIEEKLSKSLGTRVRIEKREQGGGKIYIEFFSPEDLSHILEQIGEEKKEVFLSEKKENEKVEQPLSHDDDSDGLYSIKDFSV